MCKHVLNAQVSFRTACCNAWVDCAECHEEMKLGHDLVIPTEMVFACKACQKCFRKDMSAFQENDEYCPFCHNHFVIEAETAEDNDDAGICPRCT